METLGESATLSFFVVENLNPPVILGCDWCAAVNLLISFEHGHAQLSTQRECKSRCTAADASTLGLCEELRLNLKETSVHRGFFCCALFFIISFVQTSLNTMRLLTETFKNVLRSLLPMKFVCESFMGSVVATKDITVPKSSAV